MNINDIILKIIVFIIIILFGLVISKVISNLIKKAIKELELNRILKKAEIKFNPEKFLPSLSIYIIYFFTLVIALNQVGITSIVLKIIAILLILLIIAYVIISLRDIIPNIYCGFKIKKKYKTGDNIEYRKINGKIIYMNLVELQVQTGKEIVYIPYKLLR
ncbi:mechanosensitive ion channel [Candidatus Woesearchaeota archaeon]|nr:mechanosensitive ion channel [Candidatus Woesearchaeota archaeon]